jgi:transcriptional regulator with GAF, ATPase, and Fis domain
MAILESWVHFFGSDAEANETAIMKSLQSVELKVYKTSQFQEKKTGIVFFSSYSDELLQFLKHATKNGINRILAVMIKKENELLPFWSILHSGVSDVLIWEKEKNVVCEIVARLQRWALIDSILYSPLVKNNLIGTSAAWLIVVRQIIEVAYFTTAQVLITGESGTGKELVARLIHSLDQREDKRELIVLDCTTIVQDLSGSEFFGHERGSFTGASGPRDGAFALADGGSLFLDEVGELPLRLQAELLRVVQEKSYKKVGSNTWQKTNFRLICATNRDLAKEEALGNFRKDFFYRIATWVCKLPPLRERREDVLPLAYHFFRTISGNENIELDDIVKEYLVNREYPGNIRDLRQVVARMVYRHAGGNRYTAGDVPEDERPVADVDKINWCDYQFDRYIGLALSAGLGLKEIGRAAEETAIKIAMHNANGNLQCAARTLHVTDRALQIRRQSQREGCKV